MFIDNVELKVSSGKGGAGCVSFRREKFVVNGGPDGGDGGKGGDVWFKCDNNTHTLSRFQRNMHIKAENGKPGSSYNMSGKSGQKQVIIVPPGTQIIDVQNNEVIFDMLIDGEEKLLLKGGKGGLGNTHFKSSTKQRPTYAQPGEAGQTKDVRLELKLIADVGLVGFPNVGKSTLISTLSNARPEIANYEFTTLTPKLGQVNIGDYESFIMADIPGIITGASDGKGLGIKFLRHIERTNIVLFMIDLASYRDLSQQYSTLKQEISKFSAKLAGSKFAIALTRADILSQEARVEATKKFIQSLQLHPSETGDFGFDENLPYFVQSFADEELGYNAKEPYFIIAISAAANINISPLKHALFNLVHTDKQL